MRRLTVMQKVETKRAHPLARPYSKMVNRGYPMMAFKVALGRMTPATLALSAW